GDRDIGDIRAPHVAFASGGNTELSGARWKRRHRDAIAFTGSEPGCEGDRSVGGDGEIFTGTEAEFEPGALEARNRSADGIADAGTGGEWDGDGRVERHAVLAAYALTQDHLVVGLRRKQLVRMEFH